jgi:hypothetical protein
MIDADLCKKLKTDVTWTDIDPIIDMLREERIKQNTDYSIMLKYHKVYVTCFTTYEDLIKDAFEYYGIPVTIFGIN